MMNISKIKEKIKYANFESIAIVIFILSIVTLVIDCAVFLKTDSLVLRDAILIVAYTLMGISATTLLVSGFIKRYR